MGLLLTALPQELERETGIEPALSAWKAEVLPLNYSRAIQPPDIQPLYSILDEPGGVVEGVGFEPT